MDTRFVVGNSIAGSLASSLVRLRSAGGSSSRISGHTKGGPESRNDKAVGSPMQSVDIPNSVTNAGSGHTASIFAVRRTQGNGDI
jgi:hypothetical protein